MIMDEARAWLKAILEEAEACPHTLEEWRDGLCRGKIEAVIGLCKAALSEIPEGGECVMDERTMNMVDAWIQRTHGKDDGPEYVHVEKAALSRVLCALVNAEETLGRAALAHHHKDQRAIQLRNMARICRAATGGLP